MGVFDKLNSSPKLGVGAAAAIIILGVGIIAFQVTPSAGVATPKHAHYTDDEGKTFFKADAKNIPPFDHNGKQALRADIFKCEQGHEFVGLVYRFTPLGRKQMEQYFKESPDDPRGNLRAGIEQREVQVKKPDATEKAWALAEERHVEMLYSAMQCPSGHAARLVAP